MTKTILLATVVAVTILGLTTASMVINNTVEAFHPVLCPSGEAFAISSGSGGCVEIGVDPGCPFADAENHWTLEQELFVAGLQLAVDDFDCASVPTSTTSVVEQLVSVSHVPNRLLSPVPGDLNAWAILAAILYPNFVCARRVRDIGDHPAVRRELPLQFLVRCCDDCSFLLGRQVEGIKIPVFRDQDDHAAPFGCWSARIDAH